MVSGFEPPFFSFLSFLFFLPWAPSKTHLKQRKHDLAQEPSKKEESQAEKQMLFLITLSEKSDAFINFYILSGCRLTSKELSRLRY